MKLTNIQLKQNWICWIFSLLMIVPNLVFCFTEPFRWSTLLANLFIPLGFFMAFLSFWKKPGLVILLCIPLMALNSFQIVLLYLYGNSIIAVDMFTNLFTTNANEAGELLSKIMPPIYWVCIIYLPLIGIGIYSLLQKRTLSKPQRKGYLAVGALLILAGTLLGSFSSFKNDNFSFSKHIYPINVFKNMKLAAEKWNADKNFYTTSMEFKFDASINSQAKERQIYVLVIGEASRATNWSLLKYKRETTPLLEKEEGVIALNDVLTEANATHKAVPIILSPCSAENFNSIYQQKSIISLFNEIGFKTVYVTNQKLNHSLIEFYASEADTLIDLTNQYVSGDESRHYDTNALPYLRHEILDSKENMLIVIHSYGSHFAYKERYPENFAYYKEDDAADILPKYRKEIINSYDNSIRYTDYFLSEIINLLRTTNACSSLLYCSDHGEDLLDDSRNHFLHSSPLPTYYQLHVASFAWFSRQYQESYPMKYKNILSNKNKPITTMSIFHTLTDVANIKTKYLKEERSLVNRHFQTYTRYYLTDHAEAVPFYNLGLKKEDFDAMDKYHIAYDKKELKEIKY